MVLQVEVPQVVQGPRVVLLLGLQVAVQRVAQLRLHNPALLVVILHHVGVLDSVLENEAQIGQGVQVALFGGEFEVFQRLDYLAVFCVPFFELVPLLFVVNQVGRVYLPFLGNF